MLKECLFNRGVYAIADGAIGLKEALETQFPKLQFILDRPHLKQHLYEGVDAMELKGEIRKICVSSLLDLINFGQVEKIIKKLKKYRGKGEKRVQTLADYLERFQSSVHYNKFRALGLPIGSGEVESAHRFFYYLRHLEIVIFSTLFLLPKPSKLGGWFRLGTIAARFGARTAIIGGLCVVAVSM